MTVTGRVPALKTLRDHESRSLIPRRWGTLLLFRRQQGAPPVSPARGNAAGPPGPPVDQLPQAASTASVVTITKYMGQSPESFLHQGGAFPYHGEFPASGRSVSASRCVDRRICGQHSVQRELSALLRRTLRALARIW